MSHEAVHVSSKRVQRPGIPGFDIRRHGKESEKPDTSKRGEGNLANAKHDRC